jgi:hypothetical protein
MMSATPLSSLQRSWGGKGLMLTNEDEALRRCGA